MPGPAAASRSRVFSTCWIAICQRPVSCGLADRSGTQHKHVGCGLFCERMEDLEIAPIRGGIVSSRCSAHCRQVRLIHELRRRNTASDRLGVIEKSLRLAACPNTLCVARPDAVGERSHNTAIHGIHKVD